MAQLRGPVMLVLGEALEKALLGEEAMELPAGRHGGHRLDAPVPEIEPGPLQQLAGQALAPPVGVDAHGIQIGRPEDLVLAGDAQHGAEPGGHGPHGPSASSTSTRSGR